MARRETSGAPRPIRVALAYPYTVDRRRLAAVTVAPPTLDALDVLRAVADPKPADLVAALTDESLYVVGGMRWLDAARVIEAGLDMLPDDICAGLAAGLAAAPGGAPPPPPTTDDPAGTEPAFAPAPAGTVDMTEFVHRTDGLMVHG